MYSNSSNFSFVNNELTHTDTSRKKNILVAGGAGFLGSHLVSKLLHQGHSVTCLDNLLTGSYRNVQPHLEKPYFDFIEHDIVDPIKINQQYDEIFNLACAASPPLYQKDPVHTLMTNVNGSLNLLNIAKDCGARIFLSSTSEVYGDPNVHPQTEGYRGNVNTTGPRACYDEGKRCAETLHFDFARVYGVEIKVARIFNSYGPSMLSNDGRVVSNFITQALQNQEITVYGTGKQTRSYCYVDDQLDGFMKLMALEQPFLGPVNLGNPTEVSVLQLAEMVIELTGSSSKISRKPLPIDDPKRRKPDISLAKEVLDWEPKTSLRSGLQKTIQYFEKQLTFQLSEV